MSTIAIEAQDLVLRAAGDTAGLTIKGQLRKAARALGYADGNWRVRAAWYGEAACWSAAALEDLRTRYRALEEREARRAAEIDKTHAALLRAGANHLESGPHAANDREEACGLRAGAQQIELHGSRDRTGD